MRTQSSPLTGALRRRLLVGVGVLVVVALLAGLTARLAGDHRTSPPIVPTPTIDPATAPSAATAPRPASSAPGVRAPVTAPPRTSDPVAYAQAFAAAVWAYDTRTNAQGDYAAGLQRWLTAEKQYADPGSVTAQIPTALLWGRMRDQQQYATAQVAEAHLPAAFQTAVARDPAVLTAAYIYPVTVTGRQVLHWTGGGGAESRAITLAVQCRPHHPCALA
uniref:hypothetical protein n=1 Tax=Peterkaempfera griseoplana TaxID=66896 RepID=UPI0006E1D4F4